MQFTSFTYFRVQKQQENKWIFFSFSIRMPKQPNWPCHKIGQGQPRFMFYINLSVLQSPMIHTKFQGNHSSGSGGEDFLKVLKSFKAWQPSKVCHLTMDHLTIITVFQLQLVSYEMFHHFETCLIFSGGKMLKILFSTQMTLEKVNRLSWPLAFICNEVNFDFLTTEFNSKIKVEIFSFFHSNAIRKQNWHCSKIGQCKLRVMTYINIELLQSLMLNTKFQCNWPSGFGEEDFLRFWAFLSMAAILVMWPWPLDYHDFFLFHIGFIWNIYVFI